MLECLMKNTTMMDLLIIFAFMLVYYGVGRYVLRGELKLMENDDSYPYDGLRKLSVFKMVLFWPLQIYFARKREEAKDK